MQQKNTRRACHWLLAGCLALGALTAQAQQVIFPQQQQPGLARAAQSGKVYTLSNDLLSASFVHRGGTLRFGGCKALDLNAGSELFRLVLGDGTQLAASQLKLQSVRSVNLPADTKAARGSLRLPGKAIEATFTHGPLTVKWRAVLRDGSHYLRTELSLSSSVDQPMTSVTPMLYEVNTAKAGSVPAVVGNTRGAILASDKLFAGLETPTGINLVAGDSVDTNTGIVVNRPEARKAGKATPIEGRWSRHTTLRKGQEWTVSAVVGLLAPGQARRSVLAYSERERAVPWRPYPVYISWYELNIDRNNALAPKYEGNMTVAQCTDVVKHWRTDFNDQYKVAPQAFVWDDGWDEYGTWKFNCNFPNGFAEPAREAAKMGAGIGAWLGPVGGYGQSGEYRRQYWRDKGSSMELSNPAYYDFFVDACRYMVKNYDFRFFKFDGISAQFSAVGPDPGSRGEENAEAIINIERDLRVTKPDLFVNTTVGTWASPFWFHFTDAVWRQEQDYGEIGDQGSDRERWITYRDRLVYQNFVERSPLCPINTLMTHGFILTKYGQVSKDMSYDAVVREMRCAFACGSGMVELYSDYALMDSIPDAQGRKGQLWKELADCMAWQKRQADVLPDIHWVGGNPWDGKQANVYGWAAWNARQAVLTLRNPATKPQTFTTTLRQALDIPAYVHTSVTLAPAFAQQTLEGLPIGKLIDIDTPLTLRLAPSQVYIFDGVDQSAR